MPQDGTNKTASRRDIGLDLGTANTLVYARGTESSSMSRTGRADPMPPLTSSAVRSPMSRECSLRTSCARLHGDHGRYGPRPTSPSGGRPRTVKASVSSSGRSG